MVFWLEDRDLPTLSKSFEDSERHERYDTLAVRWMFPDFYTVVIFIASLAGRAIYEVRVRFAVVLSFEDVGDWLDGFAACFEMSLQVCVSEETAAVVGGLDEGVGYAAGVEPFLAFLREGTECLG